MNINQIFELSMTVDACRFQKIFDMAYNKSMHFQEAEEGYIDLSLAQKGITVIYRNSQYKKKVRLIINASLVVGNVTDTDKLIYKLSKRIDRYFNCQYQLNDFTLSGVTFVLDINVTTRTNVLDYLKALRRVGKVKGFSPVRYENIDDKASFCLRGKSNDTEFLLYDLEGVSRDYLRRINDRQKKMKLANVRTKGIIRAEVRLTKPKAVRVYTEAANVAGQVADLTKNSSDAFMDTFARIVPFGDFYKMDEAIEIVRGKVIDSTMQRRMIQLLSLLPEKKSLYLAQKAMNCRNIEKVMDAFAKIGLSPITISKRHEVKHLNSIYSCFL